MVVLALAASQTDKNIVPSHVGTVGTTYKVIFRGYFIYIIHYHSKYINIFRHKKIYVFKNFKIYYKISLHFFSCSSSIMSSTIAQSVAFGFGSEANVVTIFYKRKST